MEAGKKFHDHLSLLKLIKSAMITWLAALMHELPWESTRCYG